MAALGADLYLRQGLEARWSAELDDGWVGVVRTVEHRPSFPNEHRALSRIVQDLDFEATGVPDALFPFRAVLLGRITTGGGVLSADVASGDLEIEIDGEALGSEADLPPGEHDLVARWSGDFRRPTKLVWTLDGIPLEASAFVPPDDAPTHDRTFLWVGLLLALLAFAAASRAASHATGVLATRRWSAIALVLVVGVGVGLRLADYSVMPEFMENDDYLFATWNGWSLLEDGTSRGWSLWYTRYGNRVEHESVPYFSTQGGGWHVVSPYFEHPPGMHLLVGLAAHLGGAEHYTHARLAHTRLVPIALAALTMVLMFLLAREADLRPAAALLGCALWATIPFIAIQSRVIKEEALLTPMALFGFWAYLRWRRTESLRWLVAGAFVLGLATFVKIPGAMFMPPLFLLLFAERAWRASAIALAAALAGVAVLLVYAAAVDWDLFWFVTGHQATGRPSHWNLFARFFSAGLINFNHVGHPHLLFLWIAFGMGAMSLPARQGTRPTAVLVVPPLVYLGAMGISSGNWTFGWYILPVLPFLCLGAGQFLLDAFEEPDALRGLLVVGLLVMYGLNFFFDPTWLKQPEAWRPMRVATTLFFSVTYLPFLLVYLSRERRDGWTLAARASLGLLLAVHLVSSTYFVTHYEGIYETHQNIDHDEYFDR
ncbi:MAG: hypothetical protein CMN30_22505 [Sandaracinus sp.]|nr:hypothetical protein [Sandaracinus sp.]